MNINSNINREAIGLFHSNSSTIESHSSRLLNQHRAQALELLEQLPSPDVKSEAYRYSLFPAERWMRCQKVFAPITCDISTDDIFRCNLPNLHAHLALTLNGFYHAVDVERLQKLPKGVIVGSLAQAAIEYPDLVAKHYNILAPNASDSLVVINTALVQDGIFVYIPRNVVMEQPIQIINMLQGVEPQFVQYRNLIVLEENSQAHLLVCNHTLSPAAFVSNAVTEIVAAPNAVLNLVLTQNEHNQATHISHTHIDAQSGARVNTHTLSLHGGFIRNNLRIALSGEGAEANAYGLLLADRQQHIDNATLIEHIVPGCTSHELYKGILDEDATGAFCGSIVVHPNAQRTEAYQNCNNLLLTDTASMNAKPQLEIYADDVRCSHGATVGQLDAEAMFYLRSRGISERQAKLLMMFGFAHDVVQHIGIAPLRERIDELVHKRLNGELNRCHTCPINTVQQ